MKENSFVLNLGSEVHTHIYEHILPYEHFQKENKGWIFN